MKILGLIPARGNSKRIPGKNIKPLNGKPLILWTVEAAQASVVEPLVSTEDAGIALVSINHRPPCKTLVRPKDLATDDAKTEDVILHVLQNYPVYDAVCLLQPTSPFRTAADIDEAVQLFKDTGKTVVSVNEMGNRNGAIYIVDAWEFQKTKAFEPFVKFEMKGIKNLDIDTPEDWAKAEAFAQEMFKRGDCEA